MFEAASKLGTRISEEKILDLPISTLNWLRATVFEQILRQIERDKTHDYVISTHTTFRWRGYLIPAFEFFYLDEIKPDLYITIIDNVYDIKYRLEASAQWRGRLSLREILIWQDEEIFVTKMLANYQRKLHYIIALQEPEDILYRLMYEKNVKKAYLSFPITHVTMFDEYLKQVKEFRDKLRKILVVFDPMSINDMKILAEAQKAEKEGKKIVEITCSNGDKIAIPLEEIKNASKEVKFHTVKRDYMLIDQSDLIVVYYPVETMSPGVLSEMIYAFTNNKEVYALFGKEPSPFFEYYSSKIFKSEEELLRNLKNI